MATKNIDSISVFLETVDEGVRMAKRNGTGPRPSSRALGLSAGARRLLEALRAAPGGAAPLETLRRKARLSTTALDECVDELLARNLVIADGDDLELTEPEA